MPQAVLPVSEAVLPLEPECFRIPATWLLSHMFVFGLCILLSPAGPSRFFFGPGGSSSTRPRCKGPKCARHDNDHSDDDEVPVRQSGRAKTTGKKV